MSGKIPGGFAGGRIQSWQPTIGTSGGPGVVPQGTSSGLQYSVLPRERLEALAAAGPMRPDLAAQLDARRQGLPDRAVALAGLAAISPLPAHERRELKALQEGRGEREAHLLGQKEIRTLSQAERSELSGLRHAGHRG